MSRIYLSLLFFVVVQSAHATENSPQFRGENASGVAPSKGLPTKWTTKENVAWSQKIPGEAWSAPIVWKNRVFVTSFITDEKLTDPKTGYYAPFKTKKPKGICQWMVYCLDLTTGKIIWERVAHKGKAQHTIHVKGSYASETPVTDGEHVYAYFGNVGLYCYDMQGNKKWSKSWPVVKTQLGWGTGSSPVIHKDRIYILNDNTTKSHFTALNKKTGEKVWTVERQEKGSWATPFIWENDKRTEIITCAPKRTRSYSLDGKVLWELGRMSTLCIPTPVVSNGLLIINSGYEFGGFRPVYAIRPGASGDITLKRGEKSSKFVAWHQPRAGCYHPTTLAYGDYIYILYSRGYLGCFDAKTGKEVYEKQKLEGSFTASPWAADGKIYCLSESGDVYVVQAGPKFKVLARNSMGEISLATPAIAGDRFLIRTRSKLYCIRKQ